MSQNSGQRRAGFTIIELMLAMSFVAALLVAVALTTIQVSGIYNKGITLREVNQVGRSVSDDLQRTLGGATPFALDSDHYVIPATPVPDRGKLCTGQYSYVWNIGTGTGYTYTDGANFSLIKIKDSSESICAASSPPITRFDKNNATELLASGEENGNRLLSLHKFSISTQQDAANNQALYTITMLIGTNDTAQLTSTADSCRPPSDGAGYEDFCAVNQFNFVVRSGNKSGEN